MKKIAFLLVIAVFLFSLPVYGQQQGYVESSLEKGKHGIINTLTGWLEIVVQAIKGYEKGLDEQGNNKAAAGLKGVLRGIVHGVGRTANGLLQLATCFLPNHPDNEGVGIPLDGEYAWNKEGPEYCLFKDGAEPLGEKAFRGLSDTVGGFYEFPTQLGKASTADNLGDRLLSICKAITYPVARILSGSVDLVTLFLPNDVKTYGKHFDDKYPWGSDDDSEETQLSEEEQVTDIYLSQMFCP
jgi:hypothetical protein